MKATGNLRGKAGAAFALAAAVGLGGGVAGPRAANAQAVITNDPNLNFLGGFAALTPSSRFAYGFRTGANVTSAGGEALEFESLTMAGSYVQGNTGGQIAGGIYADDGGRPSATLLATFNSITPPPSYTLAFHRFTPTSAFQLSPSTTYWVQLYGTDPTGVQGWFTNFSAPTVRGVQASSITPVGVRSLFSGTWINNDRVNLALTITLYPPSLYLDGPTRTTISDATNRSYRNVRVGTSTATDLTLAAGADVRNVFLNRTSRLFMNGGAAESITAADDAVAFINAGTVGLVSVTGNGTAYVLDGTFSELSVSGAGDVFVYGGSIGPDTLLAYGDGQIHLYGDNLMLDFASAQDGVDAQGNTGLFYSLTGTLTDGTPLNTRLFDAAGGRTFGNSPSSILFFNGSPVFNATGGAAAPEPAPLALFALVGAALGLVRRRRQA